MTLDVLRAGGATLHPALDALPTITHLVLAADDAERGLRGMPVTREGEAPTAALVDARSGALVAFAVADGPRWQPRVVMRKVG